MKTFTYTIGDPNGIHARPAGLLVSAARAFTSDVTIKKEPRIPAEANEPLRRSGGSAHDADGKRLFSVMSLGATQGERLVFFVSGADEDLAAQTLERVCRDNLG